MNKKLIVGTRFFCDKKKSKESLSKLKFLIQLVQQDKISEEKIIIAVSIDDDKLDILKKKDQFFGTDIFNVTPWITKNGKKDFILPLNAIVSRAVLSGAALLLLVSEKIRFSKEHIEELKSFMDEKTLVVGAKLNGHTFKKGKVRGNGLTVPWSTLAIWNLKYLAKLGFPLIGDALFDKKQAGIEEVSTIALSQTLYPDLKAKLVKISGIKENKENDDKEYKKKIKSKKSRAEAQMKEIKLRSPIIDHLLGKK